MALRTRVILECMAASLIAVLCVAPGLAFGATIESPGPKPISAVAATATTAPAATPTAAAPAEPTGLVDQMDLWIDKTKAPVPWMKWGADIRFRDEYLKSPALDTGAANLAFRESNWQRYRARWWTTVTPVKDVDLNLRIEWEGRHNSAPDTLIEYGKEPVVVDNANVKLTEVLGTPLTLTLGRQDIFLGDGWLVMDGTPLDGSRTSYLDAARGSYNVKEINTTFDFIYINQNARGTALLEPLFNRNINVTEQNEQGFILWAANKSVKNTEIDGYYMYKTMDAMAANGDNGYIHTFGARIAGELDEHWMYRAEGATQFGERNDERLEAFGFNSRLTYRVKDPMDNQLSLSFEYLSGDDPGTKSTNEAWVPLWGRWPQWSDLYGYMMADTGESRIYEATDLYRLSMGWSVAPMPKMVCSANYHLLFAPENTKAGVLPGFSESGSFRGQLLGFLTTYQFTKHLKGHLLAEFFWPGNYYTAPKDDPAAMLRGEFVFTW
jgi:hypothetical protein